MTSASDRYQEKSDKKEHTMRNSSTPPLLRLEDICVKFGFVEALKSVNGAADIFLEIITQPFLGFDGIVPGSSNQATV